MEKQLNPDKLVELGDGVFVAKRYDEAIQVHERATEAEITHLRHGITRLKF